MRPAFLAILLSFALPFAAPAAEPLRVVSFSTILTEIATRVGGDRTTVTGLVKPGVDPHDFEPRPADLELVSGASLVLLSAKHMEGYVGKLQQATGLKGELLEVGDQFPSLSMKREEGGEDHPHAGPPAAKEGDVVEDPHWWHSIDNVRRATRVVQEALTRLSPADGPSFAARAATYTQELTTLQSWARSEVAKLPRNQRKLVTSHDAFQYFARDFGFTIHAIEGVSSEDQPSSRKVVELIRTIREEGVKAIFLESIQNPKVTTEITRESGARIGGELYADGLGEGEAGTYAGMYRHNVSTIVNALR